MAGTPTEGSEAHLAGQSCDYACAAANFVSTPPDATAPVPLLLRFHFMQRKRKSQHYQ
jgi:hypothetical protein